MVGGEADGLLKFVLPVLRPLARSSIDQVEGKARERAARQFNRSQGLAYIMEAAQKPQLVISQRLDTQRQPVDARGAIALEARRVSGARIGFQRDLRPVGNMPMPCDGIQQRPDRTCLHQGRRAAAEKYARYLAWAGPLAQGCKLARKRPAIAGLIHAAMAHMAVEIAIGAFGAAEGPVQINAEAGIGGAGHVSNRAPASRAKARVRCDRPRPSGPPPRPFFSCGLISPKVRVSPSGRKTGS